MSEQLGQPLTGVYSIAGGEAQLFELGLTIQSDGGRATIRYNLPMIGRPNIVTIGQFPPRPFGNAGLTYNSFETELTPNQITPLAHEALGGRLALTPVGRVSMQLPLELQDLVPVSTAPLPERQLFDVAVRGDAGWRVVAPHAVYYRQAWTDFGIAHITDLHVARRIDRFRSILVQAGLTGAAADLCNFNDRFRGFIRYANYLHGIGVLDVILATGDLYDYMFEEDDDPAAGGNAAFVRRLILGEAPGPEFADVEELRVPILMVPGNHDYRRNPYRLIFDLQIAGQDTKRVANYAPYHVLQEHALTIERALHPSSWPIATVPNLSAGEAAKMVDFDPDIPAYRAFLAERGSYVVRLGDHRIAMIDSGHDVGVVTDLVEVLYAHLVENEDALTFLGGSPNSEGVADAAFQMVWAQLSEAPADGLFIVGVHAPLANIHRSEYPYFLRETQRPSHEAQVHGFLVRRSSLGSFDMKELHPSWFADSHDHRPPTFVKRIDSQDLLDFDVSRGMADQLTKLLAGIGSDSIVAVRPADVVLSGHVHLRNEFSVRSMWTGEPAYYLDFYTENPSRYYPSTFAPAPQNPNDTARTYVDVLPSALPDMAPHTAPFTSSIKNQLDVPPYADPLSDSADPRAWWAAHRPLVLQTGALGPEKHVPEFSGFRLLSVKANVIERIHYVSISRLEQHQYRLEWPEAIRPDPARRYRHLERSRRHHPPDADGAPSGIVFAALGVTNVVYRDSNGQLHEVWEKGAETGTSNLTTLAQAPAAYGDATGDPTSYIAPAEALEIALYRGNDGHVHGLYWSTGAVGHDELSAAAGAPKAVGKPVGYVQNDGTHVVIYRAENGHLLDLYWQGQNAPGWEDLTAASGAPVAASDPSPYVNTRTGENVVVYRGPDGHVHCLYWTGGGGVGHDDLTAWVGAPAAVGYPMAYYLAEHDRQLVVYRDTNGRLHELWWVGNAPVQHVDLSARATGAPPADSDPVAYYSAATDTRHIIYRAADGHLHEISGSVDGPLSEVDITLAAVAPIAVSKPAAFTVENSSVHQVVYRGQDNQIHELRWKHLLEDDWRWCDRCQGLFYGFRADVSRCPAGGAHTSTIRSRSANYALPYNAPATSERQPEWRWCGKCQGLFYGPEVAASQCPVGGTHESPALSLSRNYSLLVGVNGAPSRQGEWRWCNKCQGLFYGPQIGMSRCPAGSRHAAPADTGSADYSLQIV